MKPEEFTPLVQSFFQHKLTVAFAESCTAGLLASELSKAQGSSEVLLGGVVTYHTDAKQRLLGVKKETLELYSAESQQVTNEMVLGLHKHLPADVCVAVTGLCGSGASESPDKPVGTAFITILHQHKAHEYRQVFETTGEEMKQEIVDFVFRKLQGLVGQVPDMLPTKTHRN